MSEFKSWSKLSLSGDIPTLENISAYFQDMMLGLEENNNKWNLFFDSINSDRILNIIHNLKIDYDFIYSNNKKQSIYSLIKDLYSSLNPHFYWSNGKDKVTCYKR